MSSSSFLQYFTFLVGLKRCVFKGWIHPYASGSCVVTCVIYYWIIQYSILFTLLYTGLYVCAVCGQGMIIFRIFNDDRTTCKCLITLGVISHIYPSWEGWKFLAAIYPAWLWCLQLITESCSLLFLKSGWALSFPLALHAYDPVFKQITHSPKVQVSCYCFLEWAWGKKMQSS